jgi:hypothetical protein
MTKRNETKRRFLSEAEDAALALTRLDGENEHERDAESDGEPDRHRNQLQGDLEASQVRCASGAAGGLLRSEMQQAATPETGRQLK